MKLAFPAAAAVLLALSAGAAQALDFAAREVGTSKSVEFGGEVAGADGQGLKARLTLKLVSAKNGRFVFAYTMANRTAAPFTRARVALFGFDEPSAAYATSTAPFRFMASGQTDGLGWREFCFGSRTYENCLNGDGGVGLGQSRSGRFELRGVRSGRVSLNRLFVRWQDVDAPSLGLTGATGVGRTPEDAAENAGEPRPPAPAA